MTVCEFLGCTFTEMKQRTKNPVDYALILGYIIEKNEREKLAGERAEMGGSISPRGVRRRR